MDRAGFLENGERERRVVGSYISAMADGMTNLLLF